MRSLPRFYDRYRFKAAASFTIVDAAGKYAVRLGQLGNQVF